MDLPLFVFNGLIFLFVCLFIYSMWTKLGRKLMIEFITGAKVADEVIELPSTRIEPKLGIHLQQDLRLYSCVDDGVKFFVLENTQKTFGSMSRTYVKLTDEIIDSLGEVRKTNV